MFKKFIFAIIVVLIVFSVNSVHAENNSLKTGQKGTLNLTNDLTEAQSGLTATETTDKSGNTTLTPGSGDASDIISLQQILGMAVRIVLGALFVYFIVIMLYSGYQYMTSGDDKKTIETVKKRVVRAVVGLIAVVSAYTISEFIFNQLTGSAVQRTEQEFYQAAEDARETQADREEYTPSLYNAIMGDESGSNQTTNENARENWAGGGKDCEATARQCSINALQNTNPARQQSEMQKCRTNFNECKNVSKQ